MALLNLFGSSNKEEKFWHWFLKNKDKILNIPNDHSFINVVGTKIKDYNQILTFEIGGEKDEPIEFVISCDGIRKGIPFVEKLADSAPPIDGVKIIKFRQPKNDSLEIQIGDLKLSAEDIYILYQIDKKIHLQFFIKDYNSRDQRYGQIAFILLDNLIGEYSVMTKIGNIDFRKLEPDEDLTKLIRLSAIITVMKSLMNYNY
jgi:hypothetical protein